MLVVIVAAAVATVSGGGSTPDSRNEQSAPVGPSRQEIAVVARQAGVGSPGRPDLPQVEERDAVVAFLETDGADLIEVHTTLVGVLGEAAPTEADCQAVAAQLDELFVPAELYGVAGEVPDAATSELFVNLAASTNRFLAACSEGDEVLRGELAYQWVLVDRRLDDLAAEP